MDDAKQKMLEGIEQAIRAEVDGHHFYMMAAKSTEDPKGRQVFERMALDEVEHAKFLQAQYDAMRETGAPNAELALPPPTEYDGQSPIFSDKLRGRIKQAHYEMSALAIGAQLELSAVHFYRAQADAAADSVVADFYRQLADWESKHYHALLAQQEALRGDYWDDNRFSPF